MVSVLSVSTTSLSFVLTSPSFSTTSASFLSSFDKVSPSLVPSIARVSPSFAPSNVTTSPSLAKSNVTISPRFVPSKTWYTHFMLLSSCATTLVCTSAIFLICRRNKLLKRISNIFLFALITTDLSIGVIGVVISCEEIIPGKSVYSKGELYHMYLTVFLHFFYVVAFCMIILVTLDRLLAIQYPFHYDTLTKRFCTCAIMISMVLPLCFLLTKLVFDIKYVYYTIVLLHLFLSIFIVITNVIVYNAVKRQFREIALTTIAHDKEEQRKKIQKLNKRKWKSTRTHVFIVLSTIVFHLPMSVVTVFILGLGDSYWSELTIHMTFVAGACVHVNSLKDPLIYIFINRHVKREVFRTFENMRTSLDNIIAVIARSLSSRISPNSH